MDVEILSILLATVAVFLAIPQSILAISELLQRRKGEKKSKEIKKKRL